MLDATAQPDNETKLITIGELMKTARIPVPKSTIYRLANQGKIRAYKPGKQWLFDPDEVLEDIKRNFRNHGNNQTQKKPKAMDGRLSNGWR